MCAIKPPMKGRALTRVKPPSKVSPLKSGEEGDAITFPGRMVRPGAGTFALSDLSLANAVSVRPFSCGGTLFYRISWDQSLVNLSLFGPDTPQNQRRVNIALYDYHENIVREIATDVPLEPSVFTWQVPDDIPPRADYRIGLASIHDPSKKLLSKYIWIIHLERPSCEISFVGPIITKPWYKPNEVITVRFVATYFDQGLFENPQNRIFCIDLMQNDRLIRTLATVSSGEVHDHLQDLGYINVEYVTDVTLPDNTFGDNYYLKVRPSGDLEVNDDWAQTSTFAIRTGFISDIDVAPYHEEIWLGFYYDGSPSTAEVDLVKEDGTEIPLGSIDISPASGSAQTYMTYTFSRPSMVSEGEVNFRLKITLSDGNSFFSRAFTLPSSLIARDELNMVVNAFQIEVSGNRLILDENPVEINISWRESYLTHQPPDDVCQRQYLISFRTNRTEVGRLVIGPDEYSCTWDGERQAAMLSYHLTYDPATDENPLYGSGILVAKLFTYPQMLFLKEDWIPYESHQEPSIFDLVIMDESGNVVNEVVEGSRYIIRWKEKGPFERIEIRCASVFNPFYWGPLAVIPPSSDPDGENSYSWYATSLRYIGVGGLRQFFKIKVIGWFLRYEASSEIEVEWVPSN